MISEAYMQKTERKILKTSTGKTKKKAKIEKKIPQRGKEGKTSVSAKKSSKEKNRLYKVGEYLVYPMHGVGQITAITKQNILGKSTRYYVLEIEAAKMKVMVPVDNVEEVGVRSIITKRESSKVMNLLKKDEVDTEEDWKIRYQNNMNKIKSGNIYSVAEVCRNLYKRARDKELSLMERRLYESAYSLISHELALTNKVSTEEAGNMISEILA